MTAAIWNITIEQGATWNPTIIYKDSAGVAVPMANWTAGMQIRQKPEAPTAYVSLTTENGGITLGASDGTVKPLISATATAALPIGAIGVYDLEVISDTGVVTRLVKGTVVVDPRVTR